MRTTQPITQPQQAYLRANWKAVATSLRIDWRDDKERIAWLRSVTRRRDLTSSTQLTQQDFDKVKAEIECIVDPDNITARIDQATPENRDRAIHSIIALAREITRLKAAGNPKPDAHRAYIKTLVSGLTSYQTGDLNNLPTASNLTLNQTDAAWFAALYSGSPSGTSHRTRLRRATGHLDLRNLRNTLRNRLREILAKLKDNKLEHPTVNLRDLVEQDPRYIATLRNAQAVILKTSKRYPKSPLDLSYELLIQAVTRTVKTRQPVNKIKTPAAPRPRPRKVAATTPKNRVEAGVSPA